MKKLSIFFLLFMTIVATSCYDDKSSTDFEVVKPIVIDFGDASTSVNVFQFDTLKISPIIYKNGVKDENLTYEWKIQGDKYPETVLSHKMTFSEPISVVPNSKAYNLILTVTDKTTGIQEFARISVSVQASLGTGLFVADTRDGQTSDISLIMSMNFSTRNFTDKDTRIFRNVYSSVNQHLLDGVVTGMSSLIRSGDCRTLTFVTADDVYRVDPYELVDKEKNNDIFVFPIDESEFVPKGILLWNYKGLELLNLDGHVYRRTTNWGNLTYDFYLLPPDFDERDYYVTMMGVCGSYYNELPYVFDKKNQRILTVSSWYDSFQQFPKQSSGAAFDVNNIGAYDAIWMGEGENSQLLTVFKAEQGNERWLGMMKYDPYGSNEKVGVRKFDLSHCPGISEAVGFASSPVSPDFYYATKDQIYTFSLGNAGEVVAESRYAVDKERDGDITSMRLWREEYSRMNVSKSSSSTGVSTQSAQNRLLVITTYKESTGEGKVITIPITQLRSGTLEPNRDVHGRYEGFGRITSVTYNNTSGY